MKNDVHPQQRGFAPGPPLLVLAFAAALSTSAARADDPPQPLPPPPREPEPMSLEDLLNSVVTTASGSGEQRSLAAANMFVISSRDIERRGWRSLKEILEQVPGFYIVDDHIAPSINVREVSGGFRGGTRLVKVMIDGHAISFRPDLNAFIGPEFIPVAAIERVEVAKGPLSALYGANAFLATVNVITKTPTSPSSASVHALVRGRAVGFGGSGLVAHGDAGKGLLVAVGAERIDRSDLRTRRSFDNQDPEDRAFKVASAGDLSAPQSVFARFNYQNDRFGELLVSAGYQRLDVGGEFQLNSNLTHRSRVVLSNRWADLQYGRAIGDSLRVRATVGASGGEADRDYQLHLTDGRDAYYRPNYGYKAGNALLEIGYSPLPALAIKVGADSELARERVLFYTQVLLNQQDTRAPLDETELIDPGDPRSADLVQVGAYLQVSGNPIPALADLYFTGNARVDFIDFGPIRFPRQTSWRGALAYRFTEGFTTKIIAGRAFQTPSGTLLYSRGTVGNVRNVIGSERLQEPVRLRPQSSTSIDLNAAARFGSSLTIEATAFRQVLSDAIEFVQAGPFFVARNRGDRRTAGLELTLRLGLGAIKPYAIGTFTRDPRDLGDLGGEPAPPLFPGAAIAAGFDLDPVTSHVGANLEYRWVGPRGGSQGNVYLNDSRPYNLPAYHDVSVTVRLKELRLLSPLLESRLLLSVRNLFDHQRLEPGFSGVDIPQPGRSFLVSVHQDL